MAKKRIKRTHKRTVKRLVKTNADGSRTTTETATETGDCTLPKVGATPLGAIGKNGGKIVRRKVRRYRRRIKKD